MKSQKCFASLTGIALLCCLCLLGAYGCAERGGSFSLFATPTPSPTPTPTPVPTPIPVVGLAGAEDAPAYAEQVARAVAEAGLVFEPVAGGAEGLSSFQPEGAGCVILYCAGELPELTALSSDYPLFLCAASRQTMPAGVSNLCYDDDMAAVETLQLALDYPPHLAPVRMLGLFSAKDSEAAEIWRQATEDGLIMDRGTFFPGDGELSAEVNEWLTGALKKLYPGMLDCLYAETGALAVAAANALLALGRTDTEIFAAGTDGDVCAYLEQHPAVVANAVGMDVNEAARLSVESAITLLTARPVIERSLTPQVFPVATAEP